MAPPVLLALVLLLTEALHWHEATSRAVGGAPLALCAASALVLALRRPWPFTAFGLSVAATGAYLALGAPPGPIVLAPLVGMLHLIAYRPVPSSLVAGAAGGTLLAVACVATSGWAVDGGFLAVWIGLGALFIGVQAVRRAFAAEARAGQEWAERSRDEEARRRLAEERLRMARDVHDVVGHSLAVISLQAGVAEHLLEAQPDRAQTALSAIREVSQQALSEIRAEIAALRGDAPVAGQSAGPGLGEVAALVQATRDAGLDVRLEAQALSASVPEAVASAAYRIVQESLTNVLRHAGPGAQVRVVLWASGGALHVEVRDSGAGMQPGTEAGSGTGIRGMRERVVRLGGRLEAKGLVAGGFVVRADLPLAPIGEDAH